MESMNPFRIISGNINSALKINSELAAQRREICKSCDWYNSSKDECRACGCPIEKKGRVSKSKCPLKKW